MSQKEAIAATPTNRIVTMDQIRGYAIFGMLLVNFLGMFDVVTEMFKHHRDYMSYADTIAPLFVFVVGMAMRLSLTRKQDEAWMKEARHRAAQRYLKLVFIAAFLYMGWMWDALMDIGLAGLLCIPFAQKSIRTRVVAGAGMLLLYHAFFHFTFYGDWILRKTNFGQDGYPLVIKIMPFGPTFFDVALNGGPLGPLSWAVCLIAGTIAYDILATRNHRYIIAQCILWGVALSALGWLFHVEWPGIKEAWPFSAYYMRAPFPLWNAGLCFFTVLAFYLVCDVLHWEVPHLTTLGSNALVIYILQFALCDVAGRFVNEEQTNWALILGQFALFYGICYITAWYLKRRNIYVKL